MLLVMLSVGSNERLHFTVPTNDKGDNTNSNVFNPPPPPKNVQRLIPYVEAIAGKGQCKFGHNRSTTIHIFCFRQILEKERKSNKSVIKSFCW